MKRSPIVDRWLDITPTLDYQGVYYTAVERGDGIRTHTGCNGAVVLVFDRDKKSVTVVGTVDGHKPIHRCGVKLSSPRQVHVETLKAVAKIRALDNWRSVEGAPIIRVWVSERLRDLGGVQ